MDRFKRSQGHVNALVDGSAGGIQNADHSKWLIVVFLRRHLASAVRQHNTAVDLIPQLTRHIGTEDSFKNR